MQSSNAKSCAVIGAGPAGLAAALALRRFTSIQPFVYELRSEPSTMGGAINMTPNGVSLLEHLGIKDVPGCPCSKMEVNSLRHGAKLGEVPLSSPRGPAKRMLRADLQKILLGEVESLAVAVSFGSQLSGVQELDSGMELQFEDGTKHKHDFVLGCDGIFSAVRKSFVEPEREVEYLGPASVFAVVSTSKLKDPLPFESVSAGMGAQGSVMMSYCDAERSKLYYAFLLPFEKKPEGRDDWLIWKEDKQKTLEEVKSRFQDVKLNYVKDLIDFVDELFFYPLVRLPEQGKWCKGRALLLGDAAHALPPQGESSGYAIEDAVLLARIFSERPGYSVEAVFRAFESTRRPRMVAAWKESQRRAGHTSSSKSWLGQLIFEWAAWLFLKWRADAFAKKMDYDIRHEPIVP